MTGPAILIVDDDAAHVDRAAAHLRLLKMAVLRAETKDEALQVLERHEIGAVLLELGLGSEVDPDAEPLNGSLGSGKLPALEILEIIRARPRYTPVIVVTHFEKPLHELMAIRSGADAYLRKPVDLNLLSAYIHSKLEFGRLVRSRSGAAINGNGAVEDEASVLIAGDLLIDTKQRLVRIGDAPYRGLSAKEMKLLTLLATNPGTVFGRQELLESVWGPKADEGYEAVDAVIKRIRKKIEPLGRHPRYLIAVRGLGYCLAE
jgi:DNA-binding response OmpR family regulator